MVGAEVRVLMESGAGWQFLARSESDAAGVFALDGLPAGRLRVEAAAEQLYGPGEVISIAPEEEARVDVRVGAGAELRADIVIGDDHRPCPIGQVSLEHEALGLRFHAIASDEGIARIRGLPAGSYLAGVHCLGLASTAGPDRLSVEGLARATWIFAGGGSVRGQVRRGSKGTSAAGIPVVLLGQDSGRQRPITAITDAHGELFVDGVAPGTYELIVAADDLGEGPTIEVEEGREAHFVLDVPARASIEGAAVDRLGNPCHGMEVRAERASGAFASARVDAGGRFALTGLEPGAYAVGLVGDGDGDDPANVDLRDEARVQVDLTCVDHSAQLRGRAVDEVGQPLADALVEATPLGPEDEPGVPGDGDRQVEISGEAGLGTRRDREPTDERGPVIGRFEIADGPEKAELELVHGGVVRKE